MTELITLTHITSGAIRTVETVHLSVRLHQVAESAGPKASPPFGDVTIWLNPAGPPVNQR